MSPWSFAPQNSGHTLRSNVVPMRDPIPVPGNLLDSALDRFESLEPVHLGRDFLGGLVQKLSVAFEVLRGKTDFGDAGADFGHGVAGCLGLGFEKGHVLGQPVGFMSHEG